ncbi:MAG: T9SS type A sorting domain-containing protein [Ignavibacteriales bacterium]|nr:T9SS type A sorting domain-containing protein [Ignavibacteriales bacterium]
MGTTGVVANHRGNKDTVQINVEIGTNNRVLSSMDNLTGWTLDHLLMDTAGTKLSISTDTFTTAPGAFKVDYKFTYQTGATNYIYLKSDIPVFGVPDSIHLDVKADGPQHHVTYSVTDEDNELFRITMAQYITSVMFEETKTAVSRAVPGGTSGTLYFPLRFKEIQIRLSSTKIPGQVYSGTIYFDNLQVSYPGNPPVSVEDEKLPTEFGLWGNYPNPFNPETKISYSLSRSGFTNLTIYDITGSVVKKLMSEYQSPGSYQISWNASHLPSGIYMAVLNVEGEVRVHKMVLLK